jgi:hypothetical protein
VKPFNTQENITTSHGNGKHVSFQVIIAHLEFHILTTAPTFHCTTISDDNLKIRNWSHKEIDILMDPAMNEIMGSTTFNQHHYQSIFYVALDF